MPQVINTNVSSLNAQRNLNKSQGSVQTSLQRLSTGLRINSAKDDAAGLAISERMTAQIRGLNQAVRNANDGISLAQTAEGALGTQSDSLLRIRELAIQSANATNSGSDRQALQAEVNQLLSEMQRVSDTTEFNGLKLFDGGFTSQTFQVGANANQTISISVEEVSTTSLGSNTLSLNNVTANEGTGSSTAATASVLTTSADNSIEAQTLSLGGNFGSQAIAIADAATAKDIAAAVNAETANTSVTATANTSATISSIADGSVNFSLATDANASFSGISATVSGGDLGGLASSINNVSGNTGITATLSTDGTSIVLENAEGNNIILENFDHGTGSETMTVTTADGQSANLTDSGTNSMVIAGTVDLGANEAFTAQSSIDDGAGSIVNADNDTDIASSKNQLASVDISTQDGAQNAIEVVDAALDSVNSIRGDLGALQNRFESAINNMASISENLSAARSRIRDADFAKETAELTKAQILQQAGISILGQANALPQNALSLLQ